MVIQVGLEPTTLYLKGRYSTTELLDHNFGLVLAFIFRRAYLSRKMLKAKEK